MMRPELTLPFSGLSSNLLATALLTALASAHASPIWVKGSWVNLRAAGNPAAAVLTQLPTNTALELQGRDKEWCRVKTDKGVQGQIQCDLLADAPMTLTQAQGQSARAFWIAPSIGRLMKYGELLRSGPAYKSLYAKLQYGDVAKIAPMPEFDAAKRLMQAGVIPKVENEIARGKALQIKDMEYGALLQPRPIKHSLFRKHADVLLDSEGTEDAFAALTQTRIKLQIVGPPKGIYAMHMGPEIDNITGFGDVGQANAIFEPPLTLYALARNGLISTDRVRLRSDLDIRGETYCGSHFTSSNSLINLKLKSQDDYPLGFNGTPPLARFSLAAALPARKAKIFSRVAKVPPAMLKPEPGEQSPEPNAPAKVVMHEIDLDGDGVADILLWEKPILGGMSNAFIISRAWYLNINGEWFEAGGYDEQECT
jgi:hypothetical protein